MRKGNNCPDIYIYNRIVHAKLFIDRNYADTIDLDAISNEAYFSKFHFIRLFKKAYGKTPHQYLAWVRIEKAKLLLQRGISIANTCFLVGYDSVTSFAALFRKIAGWSPSAYQHTFTLRQQQIANAPLSLVPGCFAAKKGWIGNSNFEEEN
ncbi:MAG: helix-turn-helix transcriptional regulator [Flavipsychrobacter sp.]|nr:helix-turn-helix transcriptional regulator [Flavipsychrobacter sp.]